MPKLTVIMAARNAGLTIEQAIRSTLRAIPRDSEIAIWDDGSTDNTSELVDGIDKRVILFRSDENLGSGAARRALVSATDSRYIANMDADDVCLPWRFTVQLSHARHVEMSFGSSVRFSGSWTSARLSQPLAVRRSNTPDTLLLGNPFPHSSMLGSREAIERVGSYSDMRRAQDYELWLRSALAGVQMEKLAVPLFAYRISLTQVTAQRGYTAQAEADPRLQRAYAELFSYRSRARGDKASVGELSQQQLLDSLTARINDMPVLNRLYYRRLLRRGGLRVPLP